MVWIRALKSCYYTRLFRSGLLPAHVKKILRAHTLSVVPQSFADFFAVSGFCQSRERAASCPARHLQTLAAGCPSCSSAQPSVAETDCLIVIVQRSPVAILSLSALVAISVLLIVSDNLLTLKFLVRYGKRESFCSIYKIRVIWRQIPGSGTVE